MANSCKGINWDEMPLGRFPDAVLARELGVSSQVVHKARTRRLISRFETPERLRRLTIDWDLVDLGERPDSAIARELGVSKRSVCTERRSRGIPAFVGLLLLQEGEPCRSIYEAMYDAWLHREQIAHEHEVPITGLPYVADFRVAGEYVEIAGMLGFPRYAEKYESKRAAYARASISVRWLYPADVEALFADCALRLNFRTIRCCADCGVHTHDLVKTVCRICYMRRWRFVAGEDKSCAECGCEFNHREQRRFCSHACYSKSLELAWPDWQELDRRLAEKSIRQVAFDLGVRPSTLYMRLRRRRLKQLKVVELE